MPRKIRTEDYFLMTCRYAGYSPDLPLDSLIEIAVANGEGELASNGALVVTTADAGAIRRYGPERGSHRPRYRLCRNAEDARRLWAASVEYTGIDYLTEDSDAQA